MKMRKGRKEREEVHMMRFRVGIEIKTFAHVTEVLSTSHKVNLSQDLPSLMPKARALLTCPVACLTHIQAYYVVMRIIFY